jgi:hypothetical protein
MAGLHVIVRLECLLYGHDDRMVHDENRLRLRCESCGRKTPGWSTPRSGVDAIRGSPVGRRPATVDRGRTVDPDAASAGDLTRRVA